MKHSISCLLGLAFLITLLLSSSVSASTPNSNNLKVSIITPPKICNAVSFPVIAVVTNTNDNGKILLNNAKWKWNNREYKSDFAEVIEASGDSLQTVSKLRGIKNFLTDAEKETLKLQYNRLKKGTKYIKFNVDADMCKELLDKGSINLSLNLEGESVTDKKAVIISDEVTVQSSHTLQRPPNAQGEYKSNWYFGDTHSHSTSTWDYYFGDGIYTIPELKSLAMAAGLDWLTLTDHAYCLDSGKFETQKSTVTSLSDNMFAFLYGEELSCAELVNNSSPYDTCHYNGIMNNIFVPCSTDIFRKASSPNSQQGIDYIKQYGGLVTINHANWGTGLTEAWNFNINTYPYTHGETGMEILNGGWSNTNEGSTTRWVDQRLLKGEKVLPFAGSDTESSNHLGECYTVVYGDSLTQTAIKDSLKQGHQYVTTYPGLAFWVKGSGTSTWSGMGDTVTLENGNADVNISYADSTDGLNIYVMKGKKGWTSEQQVYCTTVSAGSSSLSTNITVEPGCYLRVYCKETNDNNDRAYTAPIWFN